MVYIEINGVRFGTYALLAAIDGFAGYGLALLLLISAHGPCVRPRSGAWRTSRAVAWRLHLTAYGVVLALAELLWVDLGMWTDTDANAFGCPWPETRLMAWAMVQLMCLVGAALAWTRCLRASVPDVLTGVIMMHAMSTMGFVMLAVNEDGGVCGAMLFPLLATFIGTVAGCCCLPWLAGHWAVPLLRDGRFAPGALLAGRGGGNDGSSGSEYQPDYEAMGLVDTDGDLMGQGRGGHSMDLAAFSDNPFADREAVTHQRRQAQKRAAARLLTCIGYWWTRLRQRRMKHTRAAILRGELPIMAAAIAAGGPIPMYSIRDEDDEDGDDEEEEEEEDGEEADGDSAEADRITQLTADDPSDAQTPML